VIVSPFQKPFRGAQINQAHPLARGLTSCVLMNEQTGRVYWDYKQHKALSTAGAGYPDWMGDSLYFDNQNEAVRLGNQRELIEDGVLTAAINIAITTDNNIWLLGNTVDDYNVGFRKYYSGSNLHIHGYVGSSKSGGTEFTAQKLLDGGYHTYVIQYGGAAGAFLWEDGRSLTPSTNEARYAYLHDGRLLTCGAGAQHMGRERLRWVMTWNRLLSPAEIQLLNANPYCMFRQPTDIGAFEFVDEGGTLSIPVAMHHYNLLRSA